MNSTDIITYWESKYSSGDVAHDNLNLEPFLHGFLSAFSPGHSFHYVVNFKTLQLKYVSESINDFTGLDPDRVTFKDIVAKVDKDHLKQVKQKEQVIYDFYFNYLPKAQRSQYKLIYLYKMNDAGNRSRIMLHQALPFDFDELGNVEHVLGVHSDISYLRIQPNNTVSFFSLDGRTSFPNISTEDGIFDPENKGDRDLIEALTPREKEVISFLAKGLSSKAISSRLNVSVHTVQKHRKNILQKTNSMNTSELIGNCIMAGLTV